MRPFSIVLLLAVFRISTAWAIEGESIKDNGDGTITDVKTGLMWQKANGGPTSWPGAEQYCQGLSLGGHSDWVLPTKEQLASLWKGGSLRSTTDEIYWSSEIAPGTAVFGNLIWVIIFRDGSVTNAPSTDSGLLQPPSNIVNNSRLPAILDLVRCMRPGK